MAPVCTHRLRVEGLDPALLWVTAHTHLNKQLSHVVTRDELLLSDTGALLRRGVTRVMRKVPAGP